MSKGDEPPSGPDEAPYDVGYCKPPKEHQWKKGRPSPNPRGRPTKAVTPREVWKRRASRPVTLRESDGPQEVCTYEAIVAKLAHMGLAGDVKAAKLFLEYATKVDHVGERPMTGAEMVQDFVENHTAEDLALIQEVRAELSKYGNSDPVEAEHCGYYRYRDDDENDS
jgi:hypothetical protein